MSSDKFEEFDVFNSDLNTIIQRMISEIKATTNGALKGKWNIDKIDGDGFSGYSIKGRFEKGQPWEPLDPFNPFKPLNPIRPRPGPHRPFEISNRPLKEISEPLTDVFEDEQSIRIYFEVRGNTKDDMQLNVTAGKVEVKATNFYKMINLPSSNIDLEKASSKYKNGVLEVTIPKKKRILDKDTRRIKIS